MKKILLLCICVCCTILLPAQWIRFDISDVPEITATSPNAELSIPLKIEQSLFKQLRLSAVNPIALRVNGKPYEAGRKACTLSLTRDTAPSLNVNIQLNAFTQKGTFTAFIAFADAVRKTDTTLAFSFIRPAAVLDTVATVRIYVTGGQARALKMAVRETGGLSGVAVLQPGVPYFPAYNQLKLVSFSGVGPAARAGDITVIDYKFDTLEAAELPLGITRGSVQISAPEAKSPVIIPIEIVKTRSKCWIVVMVLIGLFVGLITRRYLENKKNHNNAKIRIYETANSIITETLAIEDAILQTAVKNITDKLLAYTTGATNDLAVRNKFMEAAPGEALTEYEKARKAWGGRMEKVQTLLKELMPFFSATDWHPFVMADLEKAFSNYNQAIKMLEKGDAVRAEDCIILLKQEADEFINRYADRIPGIITDIQQRINVYPSFLSTTTARIERMLSALEQKKTKPAATEARVTELKWVNTMQTNLQAVLDVIEAEARSVWDTVAKNENTAQVVTLNAAFEAWSAAFARLRQNPFEQINGQLIANLEAAWASVLAARVGRETLPVGVLNGGEVPALTYQEVEGTATPVSVYAPVLNNLNRNAAAALRQWWLFVMLQSGLLALVICAIAYKWYAPDFIGSYEELIALFLFAFATDLTVDKVVAIKGNIKI